jgi:CubicO group peptidase (beta-lactamase class C family)
MRDETPRARDLPLPIEDAPPAVSATSPATPPLWRLGAPLALRLALVVGLPLWALAACAPRGDDAPGADAGGEPPVTPEMVAAGLRPAVQLEGEPPTMYALAERMAHHNVPGVSVAVLDGGEIAWAQGWGTADMETGAPVTPTTLFQAASISKPVTALAAMSLVDEGLVGLDDPVNDHLTNWQVPDNEFTTDSVVTLRRLLTHTAGLTVSGFPGYRKDEPFKPGRPLATNVDVLDGLGNTDEVRVYRTPGIGWQYSGGGYTVMEELVENVTGRAFHEVMRDRVLTPAGMALSTFEQPLPEARWGEASRGHRGDGAEVEGEWHSYPEQAAAGLWTTPSELLTLSAHLLAILESEAADGVVRRETLETMFTPHRADEEGFQSYGLGFGIGGELDEPGTVTFGHGGSNEGFRAQWTVYRHRGQGAVVMTNGAGGGSLAGEILRSLSEAYGWSGFKAEVRARRLLAPDELADYQGSYELEGQSQFVVAVRAGEGVLLMDVPGQGTYTVHAVSDTVDAFFDASDGQSVAFERDEGGGVAALVLQGQARLVRR